MGAVGPAEGKGVWDSSRQCQLVDRPCTSDAGGLAMAKTINGPLRIPISAGSYVRRDNGLMVLSHELNFFRGN